MSTPAAPMTEASWKFYIPTEPVSAGLDVHKETVVVVLDTWSVPSSTAKCARSRRRPVVCSISRYGSTECGPTHVVIEATCIYWRPVWAILSDGDVKLMLANAAHVKNVPGRKTDVNNATWLADLLAHGRVCGSFVTDRATLEQRGLVARASR